MAALALPYCILFYCVWVLSLGGQHFSDGIQGQSDLGNRRDEGELGRVEGGKLIRMYCMREESKFLFSFFTKKEYMGNFVKVEAERF